jgi:hypothetical protein
MSTNAVSFQSSSTTEFPLTFLHAEIVRYFKDRELEQNAERNEWFQRIEQSKAGGLNEVERALNNTLLLQVMF